jgi:hypothetical protein
MAFEAASSFGSVVLCVVYRPPMSIAALLVRNLFVPSVPAARVVCTSKESAPILLADVLYPGTAALLAPVRRNEALS